LVLEEVWERNTKFLDCTTQLILRGIREQVVRSLNRNRVIEVSSGGISAVPYSPNWMLPLLQSDNVSSACGSFCKP
jgi:hypothetical protein